MLIIVAIGAICFIYYFLNLSLILNIFVGILAFLICCFLAWYIFKNSSDLKEYKEYKSSLKSINFIINKEELIDKLIELKYKKKSFNIENINGEVYLKNKNAFIFINSNMYENYLVLNNYLNDYISNNGMVFINVYIVIYSSNYDNKLDEISKLNTPYNILANNIYLSLVDSNLDLKYIDDNCEYKIIDNYKEILKKLSSKKGE